MQAKILQIIFKQSYKVLTKTREQAIAMQNNLWHELWLEGLNTSFGGAHQFDKIEKLEDFKKQIPIQSYESLEPYIERARLGEKNVLWPGEVKLFAKSSGTSNAKSKYIPLSKNSLHENHYKGGKNILSIFSHCFPNINIFEQKNVSVAGSFETINGKKIGDLSSLLLDGLPYWVQMKRLPSKKYALHPNWEEKITAINKEIVVEDVGSLSGVPSWNLTMLHQLAKLANKPNLKTVWPNFKLYMHGGVNFTPYKESFKKILGREDVIFLETYNASEGFFAIQDEFDQEENGMLLLCNHAVFYEFLPVENSGDTNAKTVGLKEVALNKVYSLIISTKSGLWRYQIGDTVRFTSLDPFRIVLTGRVKYFINVFGEELMEDNANKAIAQVQKLLPCSIEEYSIAPIFPDETGKGGHEWFIEFVEEPKDVVQFTKLLDQELQKLNSDYEAKRTGNLTLQLPKITPLAKGTFYTWLKGKNKLGAQHKIPRLQNHRDVAAELMALLEND